MGRHSGRVSGALKGALFRHRWRGTAWALLALVTAASLAPLPAVPGAPSGSDKLVHFAMYAALMYCYARAYLRPQWYLAAADLGPSYCGGAKSVHFCANFRYIEPLCSSNSRKTVLDFPLASLRTPKSDRLLAATGLIGYGIGLEIFQYFLPPRSASLADALANSAGVLIMLRTLIGWHHRGPAGRHDPLA